MNERKLPKAQLEQLVSFSNIVFEDEAAWQALLKSLGFTNNRHIRIATEGALLGAILELGVIHLDLVILSDDAGQFGVLLHALCWIHAERSINRLVGFNDSQRNALEGIRTQIWEFYEELKTYKHNPCENKKIQPEKKFDAIFSSHVLCDFEQDPQTYTQEQVGAFVGTEPTRHSFAQQCKRDRHSRIREKAKDQWFNPE